MNKRHGDVLGAAPPGAVATRGRQADAGAATASALPAVPSPAGTVALAARGVSVTLGRRTVLRDVDLDLTAGTVTGIVGPNGGGKSTLIRALFRGVVPERGRVSVAGAAIDALQGRQLARAVSAVVQEPGHPAGVSVREVIAIGRYPHRGDLGRESREDRDAVAEAAHGTGVAHLLERDIDQLSGGERQRVHVARAIAQAAPVLLLDEPTNHLDVAHQFGLMDLLVRHARTRGTAVALALHDLSLAARYCDRVMVIEAGVVRAAGAPREVLTPSLVRAVFGVEPHWSEEGRLSLDPV